MPHTERPTRADRSGVAELLALVRAVVEETLDHGPRPVPVAVSAGPSAADGPSAPGHTYSPSWRTPGEHGEHDGHGGWMLQATHGETAKARTRSGPLAFQRTGVRDAGARQAEENAHTTRMIALVELAKKGDAEAFGQLYDHYLSTVYRYIYYRVGTHALAEDLTSETFLRALRALSTFRWQGRDFGAWLVTIARNLVTDHYKSGRFRLEVATGEILDYDSAADGPEDDVLAMLANEALVKALKKLGADQQECLVLRFLNGLSVAETAQVLAKSEGAVKQLQLRAVRNLAKLLPEGIR
jgi:RNA polymerase sigma-70 factor, ECF subfamily